MSYFRNGKEAENRYKMMGVKKYYDEKGSMIFYGVIIHKNLSYRYYQRQYFIYGGR
jgi:hypothetical protein